VLTRPVAIEATATRIPVSTFYKRLFAWSGQN
jgi:hypothetical protein